jgi:hypothetical protein
MVFSQVEHLVKMANDLIKYDIIYYLMYLPLTYSSTYLFNELFAYLLPTHPLTYYLLIPSHLPTYVFHLHTTYLLTYLPIRLPTYLPIYSLTYLLNFNH